MIKSYQGDILKIYETIRNEEERLTKTKRRNRRKAS